MINNDVTILQMKQSKNTGLSCPVPESIQTNLLNKAIACKSVKLSNSSFPVFIPKLYNNNISATYINQYTALNYIFNDSTNANALKCIQCTEDLNPSFVYNNQRYTQNNYTFSNSQEALYYNKGPVGFFHCFNFINFIYMVQDQIYNATNGIIMNYNTDNNTVSLSILSSYIDASNELLFNRDFLDVLPFENNYNSPNIYALRFNKNIKLSLNGQTYYTTSSIPNCFSIDTLIIGLKNSPVKPVQLIGNGVNITNSQQQEILFNFDILPNGIQYTGQTFYANNEDINIYHKFIVNNFYTPIMQFEILISIDGNIYTWELNEGDKLNIFLLVYNIGDNLIF